MPVPRVSWNWHLTHRCNYRCPYCWFDPDWHALEASMPSYPTADEWIACWDRLAERYGDFQISVLGGEPLLYPGFSRLAARLTGRHSVKLTTNLSASRSDLDDLARSVNKANLHATASFHPHFADPDEFFAKIRLLRDAGLVIDVSVVAHPTFLGQFPVYRRRCEEAGVLLNVWVFTGRYNGKAYPESYSLSERAAFQDFLPASRVTYNLDRRNTLGKRCYSGAVYAAVKPDGKVFRCGMVEKSIGNVFDPAFRLFEDAVPCPVRFCCCTEYIYLEEEMAAAAGAAARSA